MSAVIFSSKPGRGLPTQAQVPSTAATALSGARSPDDSGRSGCFTQRSNENSCLLTLFSKTLMPSDRRFLEKIKRKLEANNNQLDNGCFAGWNASTIEKNLEKINQIDRALKNPKSVKIDVKKVSFSTGLSHLKIHEIQRSIYLVNEDQEVYQGMKKIGLSAFHIELLNFRKEINKEINKEIESHQDIPVSGKSQKREALGTFQNDFDEFLKSIPLNLSKKELETPYSQKFNELKQSFREIMIKKD